MKLLLREKYFHFHLSKTESGMFLSHTIDILRAPACTSTSWGIPFAVFQIKTWFLCISFRFQKQSLPHFDQLLVCHSTNLFNLVLANQLDISCTITVPKATRHLRLLATLFGNMSML